MYKPGEIIKIRNNVGDLPIKLVKEVNLRDIMRGCGGDNLPGMGKPRLEIHKSKYNTFLVTLCDASGGLPFDIWVIVVDPYDKPVAFKGLCEQSEIAEEVFVTCK